MRWMGGRFNGGDTIGGLSVRRHAPSLSAGLSTDGSFSSIIYDLMRGTRPSTHHAPPTNFHRREASRLCVYRECGWQAGWRIDESCVCQPRPGPRPIPWRCVSFITYAMEGGVRVCVRVMNAFDAAKVNCFLVAREQHDGMDGRTMDRDTLPLLTCNDEHLLATVSN